MKLTFTVTDSQRKLAEEWMESRIAHWSGTVGGQFVWKFMPTVLQTGVWLLDTATGEELDLTEYTEPKYRPHSDLRRVLGSRVKHIDPGTDWQYVITGATKNICVLGGSVEYNAVELLSRFVFLDGTPCGEASK